MLKLRNKSAQPRSKSPMPAYPRAMGVGLAFALAACGGQAVDDSPEGEGGSGGYGGELAGGMPEPYDAGAEAEAEAEPPPAGMIAPPYDGGEEAETEPPIDGDIAPPFDAGEDVWVEPDAEIGGGAPLPFDGGEDGAIDAGEQDAELGGAAPIPYEGGSW